MLDHLLKKENTILVVALLCLALWYYHSTIKSHPSAQRMISFLPIIGGLAFGFNTLINLTN